MFTSGNRGMLLNVLKMQGLILLMNLEIKSVQAFNWKVACNIQMNSKLSLNSLPLF
jgi:hypothetical protein